MVRGCENRKIAVARFLIVRLQVADILSKLDFLDVVSCTKLVVLSLRVDARVTWRRGDCNGSVNNGGPPDDTRHCLPYDVSTRRLQGLQSPGQRSARRYRHDHWHGALLMIIHKGLARGRRS